ncbi:MAG: glycoside hydrolase family 97 N-terminal domain-containing protein [Rhodopirellula sp. JB044]|uniref:glycoside hydrolase family 97 protein n=1 Tax=Rhodopirellula sp. JB044 TaxID=3342844 RepID=UPI00370CC195
MIRLILTVAFVALLRPAMAIELKSPDGHLHAEIDVNETGDVANLVQYRVSWNGRPVITPSRLGLEIDNTPKSKGVSVRDVTRRSHDETWKTVCGERSEVRDHYNEVTLHLQTQSDSPLTVNLTFRAFDEGLAFRYTFPEQDAPEQNGRQQIKINREQSEFRFAADHKTWVAYKAQAHYKESRLSKVRSGCERPLTMQAADDLFISIGEAGLVDYSRMKFAPIERMELTARNSSHNPSPQSTGASAGIGVVSALHSPAELELPASTPWRFVMVADRVGGLIEKNYLLLNLNEPCAIEDTSWIKPGTVLREMSLTTEGGIAAVDFAVEHNMGFIHFDAGWYGHEYDDASDATTITVDPKRSPGPLALKEVVDYAKERGVGVIVYVNRRALEKQLDDILPLYQSWGIAGIKYGFVNVGSQQWTAWLHDAIQKAADHQLMVDVHDEYRPTGFERTYPNLMTVEGIGGDETSPTNVDTLTLLFSRSICGPADNTICYYTSRVDKNATHAYQLAKAVCIYSPWQYLYWYDLPKKTAKPEASYSVIGDEPELEFFDALPTSWDETRVIDGKVGHYVLIARRKGDEWFIGAMNSRTDRTLDLKLDFLPEGDHYVAHRYIDDPKMDTRTKVRVTQTPVDASSTIAIELTAQGGQAIRLTPKR